MFNMIVEKCSNMDIYEKRSIDEKYYEVVFFMKELEEWERFFTEMLGNAVKPPSVKPAREDLSLTADFGGICTNQTLFKKESGGGTIIAMFWPWQDNVHITLKVIVINK